MLASRPSLPIRIPPREALRAGVAALAGLALAAALAAMAAGI
ncbi:MAG: hypothetical protein VYD87_20140 [Pseudomonadota bacterium]|nr:hypothetical protein [Pseudomonadota bacterium]MEE3101996.1 hypothetical protein [Pseudomonadota bacterium]